MSFENLKEAILTEAKQRAVQIGQELQQRRSAEEQRITKEARDLEENIIQQAHTEGERQARRIHQEAELQARSAVLRAKQEELEAIQRAYVDQVFSSNEADTKQLLRGLLRNIPKQTGTITAGSHHADMLKKLAPHGVKVTSKTLPQEGGFIFRSSDIELNLTVSELVRQLFVRHRADIAKSLFS